MSDVRDHSVSAASTAADAAPTSPGGWLKQERERQAITTQRIAADMHLSTTAIDAIEADRFGSLGAPVFAKGHLRKYASLLNLPADRVAELYDGLENAPRQVDPIPQAQRMPEPALRPGIRAMLGAGADGRRQRTSSIGPWIAIAAVVLAAAGLAAWWYVDHQAISQTNKNASPALQSEGEVPNEDEAQSTATEPANAPSARPTSPAASVSPAPVAVSPPVASATRPVRSAGTPPPGKIRVRLSFARESWVEVYDSGGNRMLYDVGRADLPRMIDVEPPALVVLGDAAAVTTEANNKVVSVPPKNITGTVARFTIAADGSVN